VAAALVLALESAESLLVAEEVDEAVLPNPSPDRLFVCLAETINSEAADDDDDDVLLSDVDDDGVTNAQVQVDNCSSSDREMIMELLMVGWLEELL
jgi:hypothetical protein